MSPKFPAVTSDEVIKVPYHFILPQRHKDTKEL